MKVTVRIAKVRDFGDLTVDDPLEAFARLQLNRVFGDCQVAEDTYNVPVERLKEFWAATPWPLVPRRLS